MDNRYSNFIEANKQLWSKFSNGEGSKGLLLVESHRHPVTSHANAVLARITKEAKGFNIGWVDTGDPQIQQRLASYDSDSRTVPLSRLTRVDKLLVGWRFVCSALKMLLTGDILGFSLDGILFGDIVYDSYLVRFKVATIPAVNKGVLNILLELILNYYRFKRTLKNCGASAVLVSHQVGLSSGVLMRTTLASGVEVYLRTGGAMKGITYNRLTSLEDIYKYQLKPRKCDIDYLLTVDQYVIESQFEELMDERKVSVSECKDANLAYDKNKTIYTFRKDFADKFNLCPEKKNVFVMLHAFNDHPHSHFERMLFKDYCDWFIQTLEFAKTKANVNWVFKEHPSSKYYPTKDILLRNHFVDCPDNVIFLDTESSFNSQSLFYLADVIVTAAGTAGVEVPAAAGIPSVIAGDTFYDGFGFTIEPATKYDYFKYP